MKTSAAVAFAACAIGAAVPAANAADAAPAPKPAASAAAPSSTTFEIVEIEVGRAGEPNVRRTIIDDSRTRIEELRVRGVTRQITVTPKRGGAPGYEIITGDGSRDLSYGVNTSRGATGQRVWRVLDF